MDKTLPRLTSIKAVAGRFVRFKLKDGREMDADLSGVIARSAVFAKLDNDAVFRAVKVIDYGVAAGWPKGGEAAALSAQTLVRIAEAQAPIAGDAFTKWMASARLTVLDAAAVFDVTDRTIKRWRGAQFIPTTAALIVRQMDADPALIGALLSRKKKAA
jgi:hypothetical protein